MTNDLVVQPNLSTNEEPDNRSSSNGDNVSELSPSSTPELNLEGEAEDEGENDDQTYSFSPPSQLHDQIDEVLNIDENDKESDLVQFINKARQQGFNCLDLSKKNIVDFPPTLLKFPSLQYLYFEGNQIVHLPDDLFFRLPNLKWIDLRNNQITEIPTDGLAKHPSLRYLLLSGNLIRTLPVQLGQLKGLSALNLDGNPLEHPPLEIVKQGIKIIQQYLREEQRYTDDKAISEGEEEEPDDLFPDVWASSDDENHDQRRIARSPHPTTTTTTITALSRPSDIFLRNSKSETTYYKGPSSKLLTTHLQSCIHYKRVSYSEMRMHQPSSAARRRAKSDVKLPRVKPRKITQTTSTDPVGDVFAARAHHEQRNIRLKHRNIKIDEELQKVKTKQLLHDWKDEYRSTQQQLRRKRLVKGKDYQEAVIQAPFGIDPNYIPVMDKNQQERVEQAIRYESRRNRSPESAMREEEERRIRDRQVQDRIREITGKMLKRRNGVRGNALEEKRQAELELRELRKLESEVKERRTQIDNRFKAYTGDVKARKNL